MIARAALFTFMMFDLSPTPNAVHVCTAATRQMIPSLCPCPNEPISLCPCEIIAPPVFAPCNIAGTEGMTSDILPGEVLMFCIAAENTAGRSDCAVPVTKL